MKKDAALAIKEEALLWAEVKNEESKRPPWEPEPEFHREKNYYLVLSYCSDIKWFETENFMLAERAMLAERNSYVSRSKD